MFFKKIMLITALISGFCSVNTYAKTDISAVIKQQIDSNNSQKQSNNSETGVKTESQTISVVEEFLANQNNIVESAKADNVSVTYTDVVSEPTEEEKEEVEEPTEEVVANNGNGGLTPTGNFSLVDDISENKSDGDDEKSTDFMTVVTKNGNYLYLVIDKKNGSENVHLLNMVDESDLMSLITGEPVTYESPKQEEVAETPPPIVEEVVEEVPIETEKSNLNLLIGLLALGGLGFYAYKNWFKKDEVEVDEYDYEFNDNFGAEDFDFSDENLDKMIVEDE